MRLWRTGLGDEARVRNTRRRPGPVRGRFFGADTVRQLDGPARDSTEPNEHRCAYGAKRMRDGEGPKIKEASFGRRPAKRADGDVASAAPCPACPGRGSIYYSL